MEFEDNHPTTLLHTFFKSAVEDKRKLSLKPANFYQASIYAWNAFREDKALSSVKFDTRKGLYSVSV